MVCDLLALFLALFLCSSVYSSKVNLDTTSWALLFIYIFLLKSLISLYDVARFKDVGFVQMGNITLWSLNSLPKEE